MSARTDRTPCEQRLEAEWRTTYRRMERARVREDEARAEAQEALRVLKARVAGESERLGVAVPPDALLLDVLALVEVGQDEKWHWLGTTNNKQLPTVRYRNGNTSGERSVTRFLAESFGVVDPEWEGILYPLCGPDDVNPWHREPREYPAGKVRGNSQRYQFSTGARAEDGSCP